MREDKVIQYFRDSWKVDYSKFNLSGWNLINKIEKDKTILDVGCGFNLFKPVFGDYLWGIDPANDKADEVVSIEEYEGGQFDIILALGSLNFGSHDKIDYQVRKTLSHLKPGGKIYWRQNPGIGDHPWKGVEEIIFYPWTFERNIYFAEKTNCEVVHLEWDTGNRIYAEWIKDN